MANPHRKGKLGKQPDGSYVLINEVGKGYKADMALVVVWDYCDGTRTEADIIKLLAERMEVSKKSVSKTVPLIIQKLRDCQLIY
jgi:hypothetical protein